MRTWHSEMLGLLKSYIQRTMTSSTGPSSFGPPPPPIVELTIEQEFKMRQIEDALKDATKEDIITVFLALQRQTFVLGNNVTNLIKKWHQPTPEDPAITSAALLMFGISSDNKD